MAGVGGIAGVSRVAKAAPDGYQFVVGNVGTHAQNQYLFAYPPYDAAAEFVPAALLADLIMLVAVRADLPIDGLNDFIAHLHANAAQMQYASAGFGSPSHLACALLNSAIGVDVRHLLFRGGGPATRELLAGKVDYFCSNVAAIKPHIEAGRLKAPAIFSRERLPSLPGVATAQEQGLRDFEATNWMALFLPASTPEPIVARLNAASISALADKHCRQNSARLAPSLQHLIETRRTTFRLLWPRNAKSGARSFARPTFDWSDTLVPTLRLLSRAAPSTIRCTNAGQFPWPVSSANWRRSRPQTLSAHR
jgi:tripartite-type tricarboxylate transporter receptor subunit TctC